MDLLLRLLPIEIAYADAVTLNSTLFTTIGKGAEVFAGIIKWAALLWVLVKIIMLGFKISTQAKDSASALTMVKNEGMALAIGLFIVLGATLIQNAMEDTMKQIIGGDIVSTVVDTGDTTEKKDDDKKDDDKKETDKKK